MQYEQLDDRVELTIAEGVNGGEPFKVWYVKSAFTPRNAAYIQSLKADDNNISIITEMLSMFQMSWNLKRAKTAPFDPAELIADPWTANTLTWEGPDGKYILVGEDTEPDHYAITGPDGSPKGNVVRAEDGNSFLILGTDGQPVLLPVPATKEGMASVKIQILALVLEKIREDADDPKATK
jgi:hypothetical protein